MRELESLTDAMEEDALPLEEMLKAFERGQDLLNFCQESLTTARKSVELIEKKAPASESREENAPDSTSKPSSGSQDPETFDDDVRLF